MCFVFDTTSPDNCVGIYSCKNKHNIIIGMFRAGIKIFKDRVWRDSDASSHAMTCRANVNLTQVESSSAHTPGKKESCFACLLCFALELRLAVLSQTKIKP